MSRHTIRHAHLEMVVGWDAPLQTFFAQVRDTTQPEDEAMVLWVGTAPHEIATVAALQWALVPFGAMVDAQVYQQLAEDWQTQAPLNAFQQDQLRWLRDQQPRRRA